MDLEPGNTQSRLPEEPEATELPVCASCHKEIYGVEPLLTQEEVAGMFGVSVHAIRKWRGSEQLPFVRVGQTIRFVPEEIAEFVKRHKEADELSKYSGTTASRID